MFGTQGTIVYSVPVLRIFSDMVSIFSTGAQDTTRYGQYIQHQWSGYCQIWSVYSALVLRIPPDMVNIFSTSGQDTARYGQYI